MTTDEMNNTKFTPGPWNVATVIRNGETFAAVIDEHRNRLATMPDYSAAAQANATLMSQGPAFYANERKNVKFLGGLRDFFASIVEDTVPPQKDDLDTAAKIWLDEIGRRMEEITELLAKARGEEGK